MLFQRKQLLVVARAGINLRPVSRTLYPSVTTGSAHVIVLFYVRVEHGVPLLSLETSDPIDFGLGTLRTASALVYRPIGQETMLYVFAFIRNH
jgi:hypothetical protein